MSDHMRFAIIVEKGKRNYSAYAPNLPGCVATGKTEDEAFENMKKAITFHLEGLAEDHQPIPAATITAAKLLSIPIPANSVF